MSGFAAWTWLSASILSDTDAKRHVTEHAVKRLEIKVKQIAGKEAAEGFDIVLVAVPKDHAAKWVESVFTLAGPEATDE